MRPLLPFDPDWRLLEIFQAVYTSGLDICQARSRFYLGSYLNCLSFYFSLHVLPIYLAYYLPSILFTCLPYLTSSIL